MAKFESKFYPKEKSPTVDELKIALDNRAFEIQLFWQRSNYFLVLMSALGIGTFSVKSTVFAPLVAMFATICSYFWFRTNLGSKFWQESWEIEVTLLAREAGVRSFIKGTDEAVDQVRTSLQGERTKRKTGFVRKIIDEQIIGKPSVTYNMILLSLVATFVWAVVTFVFSTKLACSAINSWDSFPIACKFY